MGLSAKVDYMVLEDRAEEVTALLKSIANRHRLKIIRLLAEKEYSVGELEKIVGQLEGCAARFQRGSSSFCPLKTWPKNAKFSASTARCKNGALPCSKCQRR